MAQLNRGQQMAVDSNSRNIVCLAGAGTGKTFCLIRRIARLANEHDPKSILALTFTNAAAFEMRRRYMELCPNQMIPEFRTFHSFCYRLLSEDPTVLNALGYKEIPVIADPGIAKKLEHDVTQAMNFQAVKAKVDNNKRLTPKEQYLYNDYRKRIRKCFIQKGSITFNDLSDLICNLFVEDAVCIQKYKEQFRYLFIDEFQDTDPTQYNFMSSFNNSSIFVVGDSLQSIYGFRGAKPEIIQGLAADPDWETIRLEENYRSTKQIVSYANDNTDYANPTYRVELTAVRDGVKVTERNWEPVTSKGLDMKQMEYIVDEINSSDSGTIAILCRTNSEVTDVCSLLESKDIEYTSGQKDTDPENFVKAMRDEEFATDWLSSLLPSKKYAQYIRLCKIDTDHTPFEILNTNFANEYTLRYRLLTLKLMRKEMLTRGSPVDKLNNMFQLIGYNKVQYTEYPHGKKIGDVILEEIENQNTNRVYVGTVHSSKGLEYDTVFLLGPGGESWSLKDTEGKNIRYVGITRAKNRLYVFKGHPDDYDEYEDYEV